MDFQLDRGERERGGRTRLVQRVFVQRRLRSAGFESEVVGRDDGRLEQRHSQSRHREFRSTRTSAGVIPLFRSFSVLATQIQAIGRASGPRMRRTMSAETARRNYAKNRKQFLLIRAPSDAMLPTALVRNKLNEQ